MADTKNKESLNILLLGECSNLHNTLANGLRQAGHRVTVISDGSGWMNNERDIDISRKSYGLTDSIQYLFKILTHLPKMVNYDIVQIKHPCVFDLKLFWNKLIYKYIRKFNNKVFLGAFNTDYFYIKTCFETDTFEYSDYFINKEPVDLGISKEDTTFWQSEEAKEFSYYVANTCDGIIACLYEYYASYSNEFSDKTIYIPLPVNFDEIPAPRIRKRDDSKPIKFFIGIQKHRNKLKGTDVFYDALCLLKKKYPDKCEIVIAESVPYHAYKMMQQDSDIMVDQLYSYTPGMNGLLGLSQGLVIVGGAEEEMYKLMGEDKLRPIINVKPNIQDVFTHLESIIQNPEMIEKLSEEAILFSRKYHDYKHVTASYLNFWMSK
ncbi:MAG: glycosyltransferase family 1 protein [Bacteroidales bacterium]